MAFIPQILLQINLMLPLSSLGHALVEFSQCLR